MNFLINGVSLFFPLSFFKPFLSVYVVVCKYLIKAWHWFDLICFFASSVRIPSHESGCAFSWTLPALLSPDTCNDGIFLYMLAFFFLFEWVHWIRIRLSKLSRVTEEVAKEYTIFHSLQL